MKNPYIRFRQFQRVDILFCFLPPWLTAYPFLYFWLSHSLYHSHLSLPHRNSSQSHFPGIHVSRIILCFLVFSSFFFNIFIFSSETFSTHPYVALFCACVKTTQPHSEPFFHRIISGNITASKNMKNSNPRKDICQKQQIIYLGMIVKKKKLRMFFPYLVIFEKCVFFFFTSLFCYYCY